MPRDLLDGLDTYLATRKGGVFGSWAILTLPELPGQPSELPTGRTYFFGDHALEVDGVPVRVELKSLSEIPRSVDRKVETASFELQNITTEFGQLLLKDVRVLHGAEVLMGRWWRDEMAGQEWTLQLFAGVVDGANGNERVVSVDLLNDLYAVRSIGGGRAVERECQAIYNSPAVRQRTGVAQIVTATVLGTIGAAGAGDATVVVTAAGMAGSPKTVNFAVANNDTASQVGGKARAALALDADVSAFFAISGSGATVAGTTLAPAVNDTTMNISIANGTCTGLTAAPISTFTRTGKPSQGAACGYTGGMATCNKLFDDANGCTGHSNEHRFQGFAGASGESEFVGLQGLTKAPNNQVFKTSAGFVAMQPFVKAVGLALYNDSGNTQTVIIGGVASAFRTVTTTDSLACVSDAVVLLNPTGGAFTFTLTTPTAGERVDFILKLISTNGNAVTLSPASGNIEGAASFIFSGSYQALHVAWDGTNWWILSGL